MKKTFKITLETEVTIDFSTWGLSDEEKKGDYKSQKLIIEHFMEECGLDEFEVVEKDGSSLFETISEVVRKQNDGDLGRSLAITTYAIAFKPR